MSTDMSEENQRKREAEEVQALTRPWLTAKKRHMSPDSVSTNTSEDNITPPLRKKIKWHSHNQKRIRYETDDSHRFKDIQPTDIVCLYDVDLEHDSLISEYKLPGYIKKGEPDAQVFKCPDVVRSSKEFPPVDLGSLHTEGKETMECILSCAEIMLEGLSCPYLDSKNWEDIISNNTDRYKKSRKTEDKFKVSSRMHEITTGLRRFYKALLRGFGNGDGRNGLFCIFDLSIKVLDAETLILDNVGGCASAYLGNIEIAYLHHPLNKKHGEEETLREAEAVLTMEKAEHKLFVPDLTIAKLLAGEENFFFFSECKAMGGIIDIKSMVSHVWHLSLRGLFNNDRVYGCAFNGREAVLVKMEIKNDKVETVSELFSFIENIHDISDNASQDAHHCRFKFKTFVIFFKALTKILQENLKEI